MVLGILANVPLDLVRKWLLSKKAEYKVKYIEIFKYEEVVDILFGYLSESRDKVTSFRLESDRLNEEFREHLTELRHHIEDSVGQAH